MYITKQNDTHTPAKYVDLTVYSQALKQPQKISKIYIVHSTRIIKYLFGLKEKVKRKCCIIYKGACKRKKKNVGEDDRCSCYQTRRQDDHQTNHSRIYIVRSIQKIRYFFGLKEKVKDQCYIIHENICLCGKNYMAKTEHCLNIQSWEQKNTKKYFEPRTHHTNFSKRWLMQSTHKIIYCFGLKEKSTYKSCVLYEGVCSSGKIHTIKSPRCLHITTGGRRDGKKHIEPSKHLGMFSKVSITWFTRTARCFYELKKEIMHQFSFIFKSICALGKKYMIENKHNSTEQHGNYKKHPQLSKYLREFPRTYFVWTTRVIRYIFAFEEKILYQFCVTFASIITLWKHRMGRNQNREQENSTKYFKHSKLFPSIRISLFARKARYLIGLKTRIKHKFYALFFGKHYMNKYEKSKTLSTPDKHFAGFSNLYVMWVTRVIRYLLSLKEKVKPQSCVINASLHTLKKPRIGEYGRYSYIQTEAKPKIYSESSNHATKLQKIYIPKWYHQMCTEPWKHMNTFPNIYIVCSTWNIRYFFGLKERTKSRIYVIYDGICWCRKGNAS